MKARISLALVALACAAYLEAKDTTGHSTYVIRPEFQSARPERVSLFRKDRAKARDCGSCSSFQIVPFGGQSTRPKELAKYFMFCDKSELEVAGYDAFATGATSPFNPGAPATANPSLRDINPIHFNINRGQSVSVSPFHSIIQFRPRHSFIGAGFAWRKYFGSCECDERKLWFEASTSLEHVRNDMNLEEKILTPAGERASNVKNASMIEAFTGKKGLAVGNSSAVTGQGWKYGKIDGTQSVTKLSDIELKFGYEWFCNDTDYLEGYLGLVVPVGNRPTGEYVFEPVVGHHHFGIMFGKAFGVQVYCCDDTTYRFELEYNGRYLFSDNQYRSFDLKNKPWSRYQMVYLARGQSAEFPVTEGINVFTQEMKVTPRFSHTFNSALVMESYGMTTEIGFNSWYRQSEKVRLKNGWQEGPGLVRVSVTTGGTIQETTLDARFIDRANTIGEVFPMNGQGDDFIPTNRIKEEDLDLDSAAHPCTLSHTVYAALGCEMDKCGKPMIVGLGASYEFSGINTALNRWTVWAKFGLSL